jgi:hypothetical protein
VSKVSHLLTEVGEAVQLAPVDASVRVAVALGLPTVKVRFWRGDVPGVRHTRSSSEDSADGAVTVTVGLGKTETVTVTSSVVVRSQSPVRSCDTTLSWMSKGDVGQPRLGLSHVTSMLVLVPGRTAGAGQQRRTYCQH